VADADPVRAAAVAGSARVHDDPLALVADAEVDAVIIASSDATHEAFVLACLEAGKPVLCEKPLAATAEAGLRVVEAEAAIGRRLIQLGFMRRYDSGYVAMKAALRDGAVGAPLLLHCIHRNASVPPDYTSDMLITSSATHEVDIARWLLGDEIVSAVVHGRARRGRRAACATRSSSCWRRPRRARRRRGVRHGALRLRHPLRGRGARRAR
jgi:myo-inositol 2-dehydrogenase/D-chiro-inositol 1-dehydrogenase